MIITLKSHPTLLDEAQCIRNTQMLAMAQPLAPNPHYRTIPKHISMVHQMQICFYLLKHAVLSLVKMDTTADSITCPHS
jgi:hypothetical protein